MKTNSHDRIYPAEMFSLVKQKIWIFIVAGAIALVTVSVCNAYLIKPEYTSTATIYVLRVNEGETSSYNELKSDFSLALEIVADYNYLLKSHRVLDEVIETLDLPLTYKALAEKIRVINPENTRILEVSVKYDSPEKAKEIADMICEIGTEASENTMGFMQITVFEQGTIGTAPSNSVGLRKMLVILTIILLLVFLILLIRNELVDRMDWKDIEQVLEIRVIGSIPHYGDEREK